MVLVLLLLTPLLASVLCWLVPRPRWLEGVTLASSALSLGWAGLAARHLIDNSHLEAMGG